MSKENTNMVIILSCAGEELYRLNTADFVEEISIGRSPDCTWSVGHADSSTSSRHAMISRRKSDFYLTDLGSRNGIYLNDRRIKEIKLAAGMNLHLGDCLLAVGDDELIKIHYHTNEPWKVLEYCASLGDIYDVVVENMERQEKGLQG